mmetsp:Transcript_15556/g.31472  ORF Transcript_15556/g.31472 Transcript_15556/m.31472 type:complete len:106 (-) Transcript_15556:1154-1471(-)
MEGMTSTELLFLNSIVPITAGTVTSCSISTGGRSVVRRPGMQGRSRLMTMMSVKGGEETPQPPQESYVKLAMRNMVGQVPKALYHFGLTFGAILLFFVGIAFLTK